MADCSSLRSRRFEREENCPKYGHENWAHRAHLLCLFLRRVPGLVKDLTLPLFLTPSFTFYIVTGVCGGIYYEGIYMVKVILTKNIHVRALFMKFFCHRVP